MAGVRHLLPVLPPKQPLHPAKRKLQRLGNFGRTGRGLQHSTAIHKQRGRCLRLTDECIAWTCTKLISAYSMLDQRLADGCPISLTTSSP